MQQLATEGAQKSHMESKNRQYQQELSSLKGMDKNFSKLERAKHKVEEEFALFKVWQLWCFWYAVVVAKDVFIIKFMSKKSRNIEY